MVKFQFFTDVVFDFLKRHDGERFTAPAVAQKLQDEFFDKKFPEKLMHSRIQKMDGFGEEVQSPDKQFSREVYNAFKFSVRISLNSLINFKRIQRLEKLEEGNKLILFYYEKPGTEEDLTSGDVEEPVTDYKEDDLYQPLQDFLKEQSVGFARIIHSRDKGVKISGESIWLHPDAIGLDFSNEGWNDRIVKTFGEAVDAQFKIWSFELKTKITTSNLRRYFFQAVANSSWAHFGYLVVGEIVGVERELRMLSNRYGIGVIVVNVKKKQSNKEVQEKLEKKNDTDESLDGYIQSAARENSDIDWGMVNLLTVNSDFQKCLDSIKNFNEDRKSEDVNRKKESFSELKKKWGYEKEEGGNK